MEMKIRELAISKYGIIQKLNYDGVVNYHYSVNETSIRFDIKFVDGDIGDLTRDHQEDIISFLHGSHFYQFTNRKLTVYFRI